MDKRTVRIDPAAREHIAQAGGTVTLRGVGRLGCCGGTAFVPVAEMGAPDETSDYRAVEVGGITVYLQRDVEIGGDLLAIGLDEFWRFKRLRVEGDHRHRGRALPGLPRSAHLSEPPARPDT